MNKEIKELKSLDINKDGKITTEDIDNSEKLLDMKEKGIKTNAQMQMAWVSLIAIIFVTLLMFITYIDIERVKAIGEFINMFYVTLSGIVAAYFGVTVFLSQKNKE